MSLALGLVIILALAALGMPLFAVIAAVRTGNDDVGGRLEGYTTLDLLGDVKVGPGRLSLGVQNLLNEDYTTIWGQRAVLFYSALVNPAVVTVKGRGRTFGLSYDVAF